MKHSIISKTEIFTLKQQTRPHKQWFEITLDVAAWQRRSNQQGNLTIEKSQQSTRELNQMLDYFVGAADESTTWCWRFWKRDAAESALTYARLKWE